MARHVLVALTNSVEGREAEFRDWYSNTHLGDLLAIPGCTSAELFELSHTQRMEPPYPYGYMAIYEIEGDDIQGFIDEMNRRRGTSAMQISDALGPSKTSFYFTRLASKKAT
jgi:hypothetical protein